MSHTGDNQNLPVVKNEVRTETCRVDEDVVTEPSIHISQEAFSLCEADFLRLKRGAPKTDAWVSRCFTAAIGMMIILIAKFIQIMVFRGTSSIQTFEWVAPCIAGGIALILYGIGKFLPNEQKQVMKDIETHFSIAPRIKHIGKGRK
jgi:hypothetical protein